MKPLTWGHINSTSRTQAETLHIGQVIHGQYSTQAITQSGLRYKNHGKRKVCLGTSLGSLMHICWFICIILAGTVCSCA